MSGHSKWSQIKHKKAVTDKKRGQIFGKLAKSISVLAKSNPDPKLNLNLKSAIEQARALNMPLDNIEKILKKARDKEALALDELIIEAIGPYNISFIITAITDSRNRTINEIRALLSKNNARMVSEGSVLWMFFKSSVIRLSSTLSEDTELQLLDLGVTDITNEESGAVIVCPINSAPDIKNFLEKLQINIKSISMEFICNSPVELTQKSEEDAVRSLWEILDDHDDVQDIFSSLK